MALVAGVVAIAAAAGISVRTIDAAMDWLWSSGAAPIGTGVWVYR